MRLLILAAEGLLGERSRSERKSALSQLVSQGCRKHHSSPRGAQHCLVGQRLSFLSALLQRISPEQILIGFWPAYQQR
nr:hypothetical protein Q903MT_gene3336 [Picea sitchensis]